MSDGWAGLLPRSEPLSEAEEAAEGRWMRAHFPGVVGHETEPGEALARLVGEDVASLPEGEMVDKLTRRRYPGAFE